MKKFKSFLNPLEWIRAWQYSRKAGPYRKSAHDLELSLYSQILTNNMLHFGYFDDTSVTCESISLKQLEDAQIRYAQKIIEQIKDKNNTVLDVGCGMGGLSSMIRKLDIPVEALTPNKKQIAFINKTQESLKTHQCKFEHFETDTQYGTVINSESIQYIALDDAFQKVNNILLPGGRWIIVDFFRINTSGKDKSAHLLEDFQQKRCDHKWEVIEEQDITLNTLPTLKFANMYVERFLKPLKHFAFEKLRYKKPWLYYLTNDLRGSIDKKIIKQHASIDPEMFLREKKYMLYVLERRH